MTDVLLFQTPDGGDVELERGVLTSTDGFETAVYLSLFGGNEEDSGRTDDDRAQWWGNFTAEDAIERQRSETQYELNAKPITSASRRTIALAVERDLEWMLTAGYASELRVEVTIPARNRIRIVVDAILDRSSRRFALEVERGAASS